MPRGQKKCDRCGGFTGPRAHHCPNCNQQFAFSNKKKSQIKVTKEKFNWKELREGEYIKSVGGHGPFFPGKDIDGEFEPIPMGHYGIFQVSFTDGNGIGAYQVHKGNPTGGFCYLYMGKPRIGLTKTVMRPHVIKKVVRRQ